MRLHRIARALGWFSLGLGLTEVLAPRRLARALGVRGHTGLIRTYGARELAAGVGLLARRRRAPWLWSRVAGDAIDLGTLGAALRSTRRPRWVAAAIAGVAAIAALDAVTARRLSMARS